jgi:hypothetical protein
MASRTSARSPGRETPDTLELEELKDQAAEIVRTAMDTVVTRVQSLATAIGQRRLVKIAWPMLRRCKDPRRRQAMVLKSTEYRSWALAEAAPEK